SIITTDESTRIADNEAMYEMLIEAKILGSNAIVDIKMNTPTFEVNGSKWQTSQIIYTGTAVKVE
ncbi:MAG: heavy metal-binding domain-containing protein, partial [Arcobacter sp.]